MKRLIGVGLFMNAALSFLSASVAAQEEVERVGCDPADPGNECPGEDCRCIDDTLEVVFGSAESTNSVFTYDEFVPGMEIQTWQIGHIVSEGVVGWSLGVTHDGDALDLIDVTYGEYGEGPASDAVRGGLSILDSTDIHRCPGGAIDCEIVTEPVFGYIQAVVTSFRQPRPLDVGVRHIFSTATYSLKKDVGAEGTLIQIVSTIGMENMPPARVNFTVNGQSRVPKVLVDGWIRGAGIGRTSFLRGDANDDLRVNIADAVWIVAEAFGAGPKSTCQDAADANNDTKVNASDAIYLLSYQFTGGPSPPAPFPFCGLDPQGDEGGLGCADTQAVCP